MPYDILALVIMIAGVILVGAVVIRKFPDLVSLDVERMPQERQRRTKKRILTERLERGMLEKFGALGNLLRPIWHAIKKSFYDRYEKIVRIERVRRHERTRVKMEPKSTEQVRDKVHNLLDKAQAYTQQDDFEKAEDSYVEALGIDGTLLEAYRGLGAVYEARKDYELAKQTYLHIIKLARGTDPGAYFHLGEVQQKMGNFSEAKEDLEKVVDVEQYHTRALADLADVCGKLGEHALRKKYLQQVVALEPHNPHYLDELAEISILVGDFAEAQKAYERLEEVNPENQKLAELAQRIHEMQK
ncbi:MAG: hypothetical protein COT39_03550 [Parcubacteria group bacterium CG08_land_8_20_14_0_20_48_21]|nr:MAG: hypothetical protein AUK21_04105 [Parcubacteria group bacterium CG2_30_48_51]PIS32657.1 MAG: hypothetical protein COT39_03550 [Parcubacteria group bacterium CG08_land_8_20_14_0_20_48_21]PIW79321.1 MAG: hypothetical protein COZ99_01885 [Parcubacteria group bacterium CG_4_8_14_3_um_filter_48_16]PIY77621.1 MAG: hypothetical protein COY83_04450 [Parcubacteria group bacterium CG_4_10_14_0_8_um_filter_48_154]PIZ77207.1 MAG: hypothetical protein COY03_03795 [bacterium CG_4_10_14_0_2_um_filter_